MSATGEMCVVGAGRRQELLERVVELYEQDLQGAEEPLAFLKEHGLHGASVLARGRVGWGAGRLQDRLPSAGRLPEELVSMGVLTPSGDEFFAGCMVVPVIDAGGTIRTLVGVRISDGTRVLLPSVEPHLWRTPGLPATLELVIGNGVLDGLSLLAAGVENAGALIDPTMPLSRLDHKYRLVLPDMAPVPAAADPATLVCRLPEGADSVNDFLQRKGEKALRDLVLPPVGDRDGFPVLCGYRCYRIFGLEQNTPRKLNATVRLELNGKLHVDTLDLYQSRQRERLRRDLCRVFELASGTAAADLSRLVLACEEAIAVPAAVEPVEPKPVMTPTERAAALALGRDPNLFKQILSDYDACGLVGEENNKLVCYLALTSRKLPKPLSVLILSSSGSGKTALQDATLAFCPPEELVKLTRLSGKALFYKDRTSLKHKVLAIEEGAGAGAAAYAIRCLISAETLTTESAVRDPGTGKLTTMQNTVEGPTSVFYTTTNPEVDAETRSRFLVTGVDESREQTRRILARQREDLSGASCTSAREAVMSRHRNFQRLLRPVTVVNPLVDQLCVRDDRLQARRLQPQYLALVHAVAFLRQFQKETFRGPDRQDCISVDETDVALARQVALEILGRTLDEVTMPGRDLLGQLWQMLSEQAEELNADRAKDLERVAVSDLCFTRKQVREHSGWSNTRLHVHLRELIDLEHVVVDKVHRGRSPRAESSGGRQEYRLLYDGQGRDGERFLPGLANSQVR